MFDYQRDYSPWADKIAYCPKALELRRAKRVEAKSVRNKICAGNPDKTSERIKSISDYLFRYHDSFARMPAAIDILKEESPEIFWPCFIETWDVCDDTWHYRKSILKLLRSNKKLRPSHDFLNERDRAFLKSLPDKARCYRGCSATRIRGVSWTTDKRVAVAFARGHRGEQVPYPVVATALISKKAIYFPSLERNESELIIDPQFIRVWEPYS